MAIGLVRKKWAVALVLVRAGATECASEKRKSCLCAAKGLPLENGRAWRSGFLLLNRIAWSTTILTSLGLVCLCVKQSCFGSRLPSRKSLQAMALDRPDFLERKASEWMNEIRWMKKSLWLKLLADLQHWESQACQHAPYLCSRLPGSLRD